MHDDACNHLALPQVKREASDGLRDKRPTSLALTGDDLILASWPIE